MSQLDLAGAAGVSQRHISFLETGRSNPSRDMVLHLGATLRVPLREQNVLLGAAGFAPVFPEQSLSSLPGVSAAISALIAGHEPNLAVVTDRRWDLVGANSAAERFLAWLLPEEPPWIAQHRNLLRIVLHPDGLRRHLTVWQATARSYLGRLERDVAAYPSDDELASLLREVRAYPGLADIAPEHGPIDAEDPCLISTLSVDGEEISLFATTSVIDGARDVTVAELRVETWWPADARSAARWRRRFAP